MRPLLFVAMPFGRKPDPSGTFEIDFDDLYERVIKTAAKAADVDVIRADEETYGGFIHGAMYERLLLAEIVLADLTLANPNVFYELGIRHAARPHATILMYASIGRLPFDVSPVRAVRYELKEGRLVDDRVAPLTTLLQQRIEQAKSDLAHTDSPLFLLLPGLQPPTLSRETADSFRDRLRGVAGLQERISVAAQQRHGVALEQLRAIEQELRPYPSCPPQLLLDQMRGYRAISAWDDLIRLVDAFPAPVAAIVSVQEQLALSLNRRNQPGDRERAITLLRKLLRERPPSAETMGVLGRVYKDLYAELAKAGRTLEAAAALEQAITSYAAGFQADPRDYYPGLNAITLSLQQEGVEARARVQELRPVVAFAVARRGGLASCEYWDVAAVCELAAIGEDWPTAQRAAGEVGILANESWMLETTANNLELIRHWLEAEGRSTSALPAIVELLKRRAADLAGPGATQ